MIHVSMDPQDEPVVLGRGSLRFPVELRPPRGFAPEDPGTWPSVEGRLEFVGGRLLYMPPCGDTQQAVAPDVIHVLKKWAEAHPEFSVGGNEAGMCLRGEIRGADAAIWRRGDLPPPSGKYRSVPPVLAVEVAGEDDDEDETALRSKARWYFDHGVIVAWLVLPRTREVVVLEPAGKDRRYHSGERLEESPSLPGLVPRVEDFFADLDLRRS
ncbi:MAG: Uma2 family endonuclease [Deltaproteobacteria bacterium]|nr:Uma2 family endonuclease [Deltaproteobacteria bacterium]